MSTELITGDCLNIQHQGINERISVHEAKLRYNDRLNNGDSLKGFRFGIRELEDLITEAKAKGAYSLRFWKGRRKVRAMCPEPSSEFYIEDLIVMPVFLDGKDFYADAGTGNFKLDDVDKDIILASSRPCPEWCSVEKLDGNYFIQRKDFVDVERRSPVVMTTDHYLGKGCDKLPVNL